MILRIKDLRIWTQPTQFQIPSEIFKIEFPGNWTKSFISSESALFTDSISIFANKKDMAILNPGIQPKYIQYSYLRD